MENKKKNTIIGLKKANTLITKIISQIEENDDCINIMHQNLTVIGLLKSAQQKLMENHLESCFKNGMNSSNTKLKQKMIDEVMNLNKASFKI